MKHALILLHALLALLPVLAGRWVVREMWVSTNHGTCIIIPIGCLVLVVIGLGSFVPQIVLVAARNARFVPGDLRRIRAPLHPVGWVTVWGTWGHIPAMWLASKISGDVHEVTFSILGPPLIVLSVVLSWRYVLKNEPPSPPRSEGGGIDGQGPAPDEF